MKNLIMALVVLFGTVANAADTLTSTTQPQMLNPGMITHFSDKSTASTYVTVVGTLIGGAWLTQMVNINIGYQEEAQESFSFTVVGEITNTSIYEDEHGHLSINVTTGSGPFNPDKGYFDPGFTTYHLGVNKNANTDHGYSTNGLLTTTHYK